MHKNKKSLLCKTKKAIVPATVIPVCLFAEQAGNQQKKAFPFKEKAANVPATGIEPALPCENQILSLARLPIPPHGQVL